MLWNGKDLWIPRHDRLVADLDWLDLRRMVFKSDQEPAILALKHAVRESMPTVEFVMEEGLVKKIISQSAPLKSRCVKYKNMLES